MSLPSLEESGKVFKSLEPIFDSIISVLGEGVRDSAKRQSLDRKKLDAIQPEAFAVAKLLAAKTAAQALLQYATKFNGADDLERGLAALYLADLLQNLNAFSFGKEKLLPSTMPGTFRDYVAKTHTVDNYAVLSKAMLGRNQDPGGTRGLNAEQESVREAFGRFAQEQIAPLAETIHREDKLIPEDLLKSLCELGIFGISIPQDFGGTFIDHASMIIATEELSRASLGAGGSVITRPEICAKAILAGGTDEQKRKWLPDIASGKRMVSVAVTEPNAGSDVANVSVTAKKVDKGYILNGEKTWATFAGRADLMVVLARTGGVGHKGLTLFLVEKPPQTSNDPSDKKNNEYAFYYEQEGKGGKVMGHAIPTIGYRGMHSFAVSYEDYFVPDENRIGPEGEGFILQMKGFSGGRIQTAARALGVMEAAFVEAVKYAKERQVFGQSLIDFPLSQQKLCLMAARIQAGRQLTYHVGRLLDEGKGERETSLVKLLTCGDAEWVTREAMQLHGGMGYSEEYAVSRYWQDARVLSIFEGAEEVLALMVVMRQTLADYVSTH